MPRFLLPMTQEQALAILKTGANVFLTGEPGSGKSHTVNRYVSWLRGHGIEPAITASTGIAATHVGGMTVHSWSGIGISASIGERDLERIAGNARLKRRIVGAKTLIIDEISMIEARTLEMVDAVLRSVRKDGRPFGGLQTVLVGDFFQLPPVTRGGPVPFAFRSEAWAQLDPIVCYLEEQHRQDDPRFLGVLSALRSATVDESHVETLEERASSHGSAPKDVVKLFSHNVDVDRINDAQLAKLPGAARHYAMETHGPERLVEALRRGCLSPEDLALKPGAAVMFTRNDPQGRFVNGTLGTLAGFDPEAGWPVVATRGGASVTAEPMAWSIGDQGDALAAIRQVPLRLAWAMTIHKSQGMSLDAALIDLGAAFEYGQGYVALSRVRTLDGLHLLGCNEMALRVHPEVLVADREFRRTSAEASALLDATPADALATRTTNFLARCGGRAAADDRAYVVADVRKTHAKAYARWTADEEKELATRFKAGEKVKDIAERLGRERGGVSSRLKKLGLLDGA
jgi:ATP-dependent DNA helicase PIF1